MLIKYLNDLDKAVKQAVDEPSAEQYRECLACVKRLEAYLDSQLEPVRRKGFEIMGELLPAHLDELLPPSQSVHGSNIAPPL